MTRLALVTCRALADLVGGDRLLQDELRRRGVDAVAAVWDDPAVEWRAFDAVVIRSPWDYHLAPDRFTAWLDTLAEAGRPVINPLETVRWNLHKRYLLELDARGCAIPRTRLVPRGHSAPLRTGTVIKPAISGGAYRTLRVGDEPTAEQQALYETMLAEGDVLVQEYVPEVPTRGEWSLMFFDGVFSHAVLKRAAAGDFRVQVEWGGRVEAAEPPASIMAAAQQVIGVLPRLPFARIDLVETAGGPLLMEAELIEPELFVEREPAAAGRFAGAVERCLRLP